MDNIVSTVGVRASAKTSTRCWPAAGIQAMNRMQIGIIKSDS